MEEKPSTLSSNSLPVLRLLALLCCIGPLSDLLPTNWLHPSLRLHLDNPSFIYICCAILLCTYFKQGSFTAYLIGAFGLILINLPFPMMERLYHFGRFSISFSLVAYWVYLRLPSALLMILFCLDVSIAFQSKVFFGKVIPCLSPLSWSFDSHPEHFFYLFILPGLAFIYRKLRPLNHELP